MALVYCFPASYFHISGLYKVFPSSPMMLLGQRIAHPGFPLELAYISDFFGSCRCCTKFIFIPAALYHLPSLRSRLGCFVAVHQAEGVGVVDSPSPFTFIPITACYHVSFVAICTHGYVFNYRYPLLQFSLQMALHMVLPPP